MQKSGYRINEKIGKDGVINFECNPFYSQLYYWWDINEGKGKHNVSFPPELLFRSLKFYLTLWTYVYFIQFKCVLLNIACINKHIHACIANTKICIVKENHCDYTFLLEKRHKLHEWNAFILQPQYWLNQICISDYKSTSCTKQ